MQYCTTSVICYCWLSTDCECSMLWLLSVGWTLGDAIIGRYLNPRILNVDVKMFLLLNVAMLGHLAVSTITLIEAYQRDKLHAAMILLMSYTTIVCLVTLALQVQ